MTDILETLEDRGKEYGKFMDHAIISQSLKNIIADSTPDLNFDQAEALDMIVHKIARIVNGNPDNIDSWHDIAGYATLVEKRLTGEAL